MDRHQRKIKLHSSSLCEVTVSELNDQIDKLNLNNSFVNIQYRSKPTIQPIASIDALDGLNVDAIDDRQTTESQHFVKQHNLSNCSTAFPVKAANGSLTANRDSKFSNGELNHKSNRNLNAQNAQRLKSLPDLISGRDCQTSKTAHFSFPTTTQLNAGIHGRSLDRASSITQNDARNSSKFDMSKESSIFNAKLNQLIDSSLLQSNTSNDVSNKVSNTMSNAVASLNTVPSIPPKAVKSNQTMNYCNIAQIVETDKCNQISIDFAPPLPPRLRPKKAVTAQISRKIDFNALSDLKFNRDLNEKLSQNLNQQFDQVNNQANHQATNQSLNQVNGQLPKNALLVSSNSVLNGKHKQRRQARSTETIKFRSNSINLPSTSTQPTFDKIVDEFAAYEKERKHHSDNEIIRDFIQINKNLNEFSIGVNDGPQRINQSMNASSTQTTALNQSNLERQIDDCQFKFRNKKPSLTEHTSSIVQLSESQLNQYLNSNDSTSDKMTTESQTKALHSSSSTNNRPSSQYDNLSLSEYSEPNITTASCHPASLSSTFSSCANSHLPISTHNSSLNTMATQNSLNLSWQSNNFSTTSLSSSNHIDHFDTNHSNRSSNRSSDRSSNRSSIRSSIRSSNRSSDRSVNQYSKDNESQSSYENNQDDELPPPIPPKKNISVYCQLFSSYTAPKDNALAKCYRYSVHTVQEIYRSQATYQQVELSFNQQKQFHNSNNQLTVPANELQPTTRFNGQQTTFSQPNSNRLTAGSLTTSSDDSMFSIDSFNSDSSKEINCLPLPPKKINPIAIPEKPEAYRFKKQTNTAKLSDASLTKFQHHHSFPSNDANLNEIKTAKLKHFDTLDFTCRSDSPTSLAKSER